MSSSVAVIFITIIVYLVATLWIGVECSKQNKNTDDFYLGGRKLGPIVTAMSAEASDMSSYLLMGLPGLAYLSGLCEVGWTVIGLAAGTWLNWFIVARRVRKYSQQINAITIPDFFSKRYHDEKNIISLLSAIVIVIFFIPYTASGFAACGKLFADLFDINYVTAMVVFAVVIIAYTTMGGFLAASTTDLIQSIVMTLALIVVVIFGINLAGGMDAVAENAKGLSGYLSFTSTHNAETGNAESYGFLQIVSTLAWGLGYFGMPHILLRFMAIKEEKKLVLSRRIATCWVVISMAVSVLIGVVGLAATNAGKIEFLSGSDSETIIIKIATILSEHGVIAAIMAGVTLAGILAATMSTADSQLLAAASSVSENVVSDFLGIRLSEKKSLLVARLTVIAISIIGIFLARDPNSSVFGIVSFAWAGFGAAFGPVMLLALFWKNSNKWGALFGMLSGGAMVFIWKFLIKPIGGVFGIYELLPAFLIALLVNVIVSLATKGATEDIHKELESVDAKTL